MVINERMHGFGVQPSEIRDIAAKAAERKAQLGPENVFDFSIGNPSVPAPDSVRQSILRAMELPSVEVHGYTHSRGYAFVREAVAASLTRNFSAECGDAPVASMEDVYMTCGAMASLASSMGAIINPGDEVIAIAPYFSEYRVFVEMLGGVFVEVLADPATFQIDAEAVARAITPRTRAIIVNSPNNPVGTVYSRATLEALAATLHAKEGELGTVIDIICDEPYRLVVYGAEVPWVPAIYDRTIVCYSYSKALSLPGERIGWVLVPPTHPEHDLLVDAVAGAGRALGYTCAPSLFQRVVADCIDEPCPVEEYARNRDALTKGLSELGYEYIEPDGAFYLWVKSLEPDAHAFYEKAQALNLFPVPSDSFGCTGWLRVSYCVSYDTIVNSMPAWAELMESYRS